MSIFMPSNTENCGLGFEALLLGGVGGLSLIRKKLGISIRLTMKALARMKNSKLIFALWRFSSSLSSSHMSVYIRILLMKIPAGPLIMLIPVANPLSCLPNQLLVNLVTGFLRNAEAHKLIIWPKNTGQKFPWYTLQNTLIVDPTNINADPHIIQALRPHLSMTSELMTMHGMYRSRSAYFAVYNCAIVTWGW